MARRIKSPVAAVDASVASTQAPMIEAVSFSEPVSFVEPDASGEDAPIVESAPVLETAPSLEDFVPAVEYAPHVEAAPVWETAPSAETFVPAVESAASFEHAPGHEASPVAEAVPSVEEFVPVVDEPTPAFVNAPISVAPVIEDTPVMEDTPILETASAPHVEAVAAAPTAAVSKILEAPMASIAEAQGKVRTMVETGLNETHAKYSQMKSAADEAAHALEASYATVKNGALQFNVKALEALSATATANFDFFKSVFAVKSPSEYVVLHSEFARKHIEMMTAQTKAFGELAQKLAAETVEPIKAQVAKTFNMH